jgi:hypothetical protein
VGAEVIETKDNWNYTRGLLFTFAIPRYHVGAKGTYVVDEKTTLAGYVVNGWDNVRDNNTAKSVGFIAHLKPIDKLGVTTNLLFGKENSTEGYTELYDGIVTYEASNRVSVMANYDYVRNKAPGPGVFWQGVAVYAKAKASEKLTLASRYEWLGDRHHAFRTGNDQNAQSFTATSQVPWSDITFWGEYRRDWSTIATFNRTKGIDTSVEDNQNTFTLGLTYGFKKIVQ